MLYFYPLSPSFGNKGWNQPTENGSTLTKSTCLHYISDLGWQLALRGLNISYSWNFWCQMLQWRLAPVCLFHLVWLSNLLEAQNTQREYICQRGAERIKVNISISNRGYYTLSVVYLNWKTLKDILKQMLCHHFYGQSPVEAAMLRLATWGQNDN